MAQAKSNKPNILVLWGDDIGYWNISAYNQGIMGYKTPNIDRIAKEGALFTDCVRPAELHRRPRVLHPRPASVSYRPAHHRNAGLAARHPGLDADHRRPAQGAGLHDRSVRQEPPRRPGQTPADRPWLRRVFGKLYHLNAEEEPET